jgi:hypothetical protein
VGGLRGGGERGVRGQVSRQGRWALQGLRAAAGVALLDVGSPRRAGPHLDGRPTDGSLPGTKRSSPGTRVRGLRGRHEAALATANGLSEAPRRSALARGGLVDVRSSALSFFSPPIHPTSARKVNSATFACTGFSEVRVALGHHRRCCWPTGYVGPFIRPRRRPLAEQRSAGPRADGQPSRCRLRAERVS